MVRESVEMADGLGWNMMVTEAAGPDEHLPTHRLPAGTLPAGSPGGI